MRSEASGIFHVQLFGGGNWWCTWDGRPFLALRSDCAKIRRNISRGHFVSKHQWLANYRFFCCAHRARWSHLVDSEFPPVFHDRGARGLHHVFLFQFANTRPCPRWGVALRGAQRDRIICALSVRSLARRLFRGVTQSTLAFSNMEVPHDSMLLRIFI